MLNIGKLAAGGEDYYLSTVARSVESYDHVDTADRGLAAAGT